MIKYDVRLKRLADIMSSKWSATTISGSNLQAVCWVTLLLLLNWFVSMFLIKMTQHDMIDISVSCVTVTCVILRLLIEKITTNSSLQYIDIDDVEHLISSLKNIKSICKWMSSYASKRFLRPTLNKLIQKYELIRVHFYILDTNSSGIIQTWAWVVINCWLIS